MTLGTERQWVSVSDLMSVLMMIFLFISVIFMVKVEDEKQRVEAQNGAMAEVAENHGRMQEELHRQLRETFVDDLKKWDAEMPGKGVVRFNNPESLFARGSSELTDRYKANLAAFFPRYVGKLAASDYREDITEILIEGHTSSDWGGVADSEAGRYTRNLKLSQERAFNVLIHVYHLPEMAIHRDWLRRVLRATGAAYARPLLGSEGEEDRARSRRVEFRIRTSDDEKLERIQDIIRDNTIFQ